MFKVFCTVFFIFTLTQNLCFAQNANTVSKPDWDSTNIMLHKLATDHISTFDFVDQMSVQVDKAQSDWPKGNLKLDMNVQSIGLSLISTPETQYIELNGGLDIDTQDLKDDQKQVNLNLEIELSGQMLYLLRHINALLMDCSVTPDVSDVFGQNFCDYANVIANNDEAKDWQPALVSLRAAILSFQKSPSSGSATTSSSDLLNQIFKALAASQVGGNATESNLSSQALIQIFGLDLKSFVQLKLSNSKLVIHLSGQTQIDSKDYEIYKKQIAKYLVKFQQGDTQTLEKLYEYTFIVFGLLEGFLV